ncbi:MAG: molybdenum cofactor biosynthesis protein MoaE [Pyrinomonadaceae bacterium]|nr:molybdenum cofactor biosynthesis protein MoaE [Pyrinomonadaceae bacterium]
MTSDSLDLKHRHGDDNDGTRTTRVRLLFFGAAREAAGCDEAPLAVGAPATAASVFTATLNAFPALRRFGRSLLIAVNEEYATPEMPVGDGDEIALFPPVSGGSSAGGEALTTSPEQASDFFELTADALDVGEIARRVVPPRCGATVTLDGYVREFTRGRERTLYLVYEAYAPMALSELRRLGRHAHELFDIQHIGIVHRLGRLEIGETSVIISVSAPHRRATFAACEWAIKELKRTVPVWKKEYFEGGEVWSEGEGAPENSGPEQV